MHAVASRVGRSQHAILHQAWRALISARHPRVLKRHRTCLRSLKSVTGSASTEILPFSGVLVSGTPVRVDRPMVSVASLFYATYTPRCRTLSFTNFFRSQEEKLESHKADMSTLEARWTCEDDYCFVGALCQTSRSTTRTVCRDSCHYTWKLV